MKPALRSGHSTPIADAELTRVAAVEPQDGTRSVFCDSPVLVRLSKPADPGTATASTVRVEDEDGPVPGHVHISPDGRLVIWHGARLLAPEVVHIVVVSGLRDRSGRIVVPHFTTFRTCDLAMSDMSP